jgi:hypothetical protein
LVAPTGDDALVAGHNRRLGILSPPKATGGNALKDQLPPKQLNNKEFDQQTTFWQSAIHSIFVTD